MSAIAYLCDRRDREERIGLLDDIETLVAAARIVEEDADMLRWLMRRVLWKAEFLSRDTSGMLYVQKARAI